MAKSIGIVVGLLFLVVLLSAYKPGAVSSRERLQKVYTSQVGVKERSNRNDGREIRKYLSSCGLKEGYAWCGAFLSWAFDSAGIAAPNFAWTPSWYQKSRLVWQRGWKQPKQQPQRGDVVLYYIPAKGRIGHAGFFDRFDGKYCQTVEGNVNIGGRHGVYRIKRSFKSFYAILNYTDQN